MKGFLLAIAVLVLPLHSYSAELKLSCNMRSKYTMISGSSETSAGTAMVEIMDYGKRKFIFITSTIEDVNNISVVSHIADAPGWKFDFHDSSNDGKYEITNFRKSFAENVESYKRVVLDRNTGNIYINTQRTSQLGSSSLIANGSCEKIDSQKKKF